MSIADDQIARQITGTIIVTVHFTDDHPDSLSLVEQDNLTWIKPAFCTEKRIPRELYDELCEKFTNEQQFCTDPEVIRSGMRYDDFYNRYYNNV